MKKKIIISSAIFLSVIIVAIIIFFIYISQLSYGGSFTIDASMLNETPIEEEITVTIKDKEKKREFLLTYYNVYKNEDNEFVLKDNTSYIKVEGIYLFLWYDNYKLKVINCDDLTTIESTKSDDSDKYYINTIGISDIILSLDEYDINQNVNIGKLTTGR